MTSNEYRERRLVVAEAAILILLIVHDRVIQKRSRADRAVAFYERGLARLEDRWAGTGEDGESFRDPAHPYAAVRYSSPWT